MFKANFLTLANKHYKVLEKEVNVKLSTIDNWMRINKLTINYKKTEFILITKKKIDKFDIRRCACNNVLRLVAASLFTIFISTCTMINFKLIVSKNEINENK